MILSKQITFSIVQVFVHFQFHKPLMKARDLRLIFIVKLQSFFFADFQRYFNNNQNI
jgi:hypothetical protein